MAGGKLKYLEKNLAQCQVNCHKCFIYWSRIEPRSLRWEADRCCCRRQLHNDCDLKNPFEMLKIQT